MTDKEMKFAEIYIGNGNAVKAATKAGYSAKTARFAANWLNPHKPTKYKPELAEYIKQLTQEQQEARILTAGERKVILSDIAKNKQAFPADRVRAIDTLNKMTGEYITKIEGSISAEVNDPFKELTTEELRRLAEDG